MSFQTTPFSFQENAKKYEISSFDELGLTINMLNEIGTNKRKLPSGNIYKFGVIIDGSYFWYFNGTPVKSIKDQRVDRAKMREIYSVLFDLNKNTSNTPFAFKVKK